MPVQEGFLEEAAGRGGGAGGWAREQRSRLEARQGAEAGGLGQATPPRAWFLQGKKGWRQTGVRVQQVVPVGAEHRQVIITTLVICFNSPGGATPALWGLGRLVDRPGAWGGQCGSEGRASPHAGRRTGLLSRQPWAAGALGGGGTALPAERP